MLKRGVLNSVLFAYINCITLYHMKERKREPKLVFIAVLFTLLAGYPFLQMASAPDLILGIPKLFAYLFMVWILLILAIAFVMRSHKRKKEYE